jgi:YidC/Oxa1 family membrane protein insertase
MNDIRRTILWVIFGFSMVLLWDKWQIHNGQKGTFLLGTKASVSAPAPAVAPAASSVPAASGVPATAAVPAPGAATVSSVPGTAAPATATAPREQVTVTTDVLRLTFDSEGGTIVKTEFLKQLGDDKTGTFVLLEQNTNRVYVAQSGLIGGAFPTHKTPMTVSGERELKDGANMLAIRFESEDVGGVKLVKTYTFRRGAYDVAVKHEVVNTGTAAVSPQLYMQLVRDGNKLPGESSFYSTFTGPAVYTEAKKYHKVEFKDIENNKADIDKESTSGYVAMVQHYFASAWILPEGVKRELFVRKVDNNLYAVGMIAPLDAIAPGASKAVDAKFFAGPQLEKTLEQITPGLELIKIAFYWLQAKGYQSMAKMKAINPKVMAMRERFKDNPQQMQQEMMKIYREEKVNPMGGCLPIMVQIPVFIALYWVLLSSVEMRGAPWVGWIHDLSAPDPFYILPVVMTLTTMLQTALNPAPPDPMQAKMMWIMPLAFSVMFFFFPSGLVLYWITNNVLSIAQQWLINTRMGVPPQFNLPKFR